MQTLCLESGLRTAPNRPKIQKMTMTSQLSILSLVLELWHFFYNGLIRNPEIGNTLVWVLPNIWRLGRVMDTKFGMSLTECYWMLQHSRLTVFANKITPLPSPTSPPRLGLKSNSRKYVNFWYITTYQGM